MKEELLRYAENANRQALEYVEKAVSQSKESTAAKYKKYYQRLVDSFPFSSLDAPPLTIYQSQPFNKCCGSNHEFTSISGYYTVS